MGGRGGFTAGNADQGKQGFGTTDELAVDDDNAILILLIWCFDDETKKFWMKFRFGIDLWTLVINHNRCFRTELVRTFSLKILY